MIERKVARTRELDSYNDADGVMYEAEPPGLWVVQRNWKDLVDHHIFEDGEGSVEMLVAVLGSGQVFGELAVLDPTGRTPSSAVAVTSVEIKMFRIRSTWSNSNGFGERDRLDLEISRRDDRRSKNEPKRPCFERDRRVSRFVSPV